MSERKLFGYAVIDQGKKAEKDQPEEAAKILMNPTYVIAKDAQEVLILAGRQIPEEYLTKLSRIDIIVRPF